MITKFGSLYAGHVDLDDIGFDGLPVNDRWLSDERLASVFDKAEAIARTLDDGGFDAMWLAEHHFQREGHECIPNILMLAVHLSHLTERIKFGCGFNITPMWHPLRLAEDYAMADHLTGGRVIFGIGRGYHTREVEVFDAPLLDNDANRKLFDEQAEIIFKALHEPSFSHRGEHYTIPPPVPYRGYQLEDITLVPPPRTRPVECYQPIVSANPRSLDRMARYGIKGMIGGGAAAGGAHDATVTAWRDALGPGRTRHRTRRRPHHRPGLPHRRKQRAGNRRGPTILRGEHENVRTSRIRARTHRRPDRRDRRPFAHSQRRPSYS